jgi:hypothetical protein
MLDFIEIVLLCFNVLIFILLWRVFVAIALVHDVVKFFVLDKLLRGKKNGF